MRAASFDSLAILGIPITGRPTTDQTLKYNGTNWTFADLASGGSGDVLGGTNLTTAGAIPYVSASGTLNQNVSALFWNNATAQLRIGSATAPDSNVGILVKASSPIITTQATSSTGNTAWNIYNSGGSVVAQMQFDHTNSKWLFNSAAPIGIGPSNTSPTGTLHVYDARATTGVTTLTVQAGAGQSTTRSLEFLDSAGGNPVGFRHDSVTNRLMVRQGTTDSVRLSQFGVEVLGTGGRLYWTDSGVFGATDLAISRSGAGNLSVNNGSSTTYATIGAGGIQMGTDNTYPIGASGSGRPSALFVAGTGTFGGNLSAGVIVSSGGLSPTTAARTFISSPADGNLLLANAAASTFDRLQFGGTTSSFPALKRSSTTLQARLADDSAYTPFVSSNLQRGTGAPESAVTGVVGDLFQRTDGGAATSLYLKESGSGNTGWSPLTAVQKNGVYLQVGETNYLMPGLFPVTLPTTSGMSWLANQGTATASTSSTGGALKLNFTTGTSGWRVYGKSISGFTKVTVAVGCPGFADGTSSRADLEFCGFGLRDSSTGRLQLWHTQNFSGTTYFGVSNFTNATTYSGHERINYLNMSLALLYLQVEISGSTAIYRISSDGFNWETVLTTSSFLGTPDEVFVAGQAGSTGDIPMFVYSWKEE